VRKLVKSRDLCLTELCDIEEMSTQQRRREYSTDSLDGDRRERIPSDDLYYQGMLKSLDGRKGTRDDTPAHKIIRV